VVDVDERHAQRAAVAGCALDLGEEGRQQGLAIGDAGEAVDGGAVVGVGQRGRDAVDRNAETRFETAAARRDGDGVVARGDQLGGLDEAPEAEAKEDQGQQRREAHADDQRGDRGHDRMVATDGPRRREARICQEQGPHRERSHQREDPQQAHHLRRVRFEERGTDRPDVPSTLRRKYGRCPAAPGRAGSRTERPAILRPSSHERVSPESGGQRSRFRGASAVPRGVRATRRQRSAGAADRDGRCLSKSQTDTVWVF